jgi:hypothetical protein
MAEEIEEKTIVESEEDHEFLLRNVEYMYVNTSKMIGNNWDVRLAFGERVLDKVSPRIGLSMSHQHFKAFVGALNLQLEKIEQLFGVIEFQTLKDRSQEQSGKR